MAVGYGFVFSISTICSLSIGPSVMTGESVRKEFKIISLHSNARGIVIAALSNALRKFPPYYSKARQYHNQEWHGLQEREVGDVLWLLKSESLHVDIIICHIAIRKSTWFIAQRGWGGQQSRRPINRQAT